MQIFELMIMKFRFIYGLKENHKVFFEFRKVCKKSFINLYSFGNLKCYKMLMKLILKCKIKNNFYLRNCIKIKFDFYLFNN